MSTFQLHPGVDFRIMIVDDNPDEFPLIEAGFQHHAYPIIFHTVTVAHLALVEFVLCDVASRPHLALVDINMPAIDGFGLAKEFIGCGLQTILMSNQVDAVRLARAAALGALALLEKPGDFLGYAAFAARVIELFERA